MITFFRATIFITILFCMFEHEAFGQEKKGVEIPLETKIKIRKLIYNSKLRIQTNHNGELPRRTLKVPEEIKSVFKQYPLGVSSLFLTIVEGARPRDAHAAYCYAIALNFSPVSARLRALSLIHI